MLSMLLECSFFSWLFNTQAGLSSCCIRSNDVFGASRLWRVHRNYCSLDNRWVFFLILCCPLALVKSLKGDNIFFFLCMTASLFLYVTFADVLKILKLLHYGVKFWWVFKLKWLFIMNLVGKIELTFRDLSQEDTGLE